MEERLSLNPTVWSSCFGGWDHAERVDSERTIEWLHFTEKLLASLWDCLYFFNGTYPGTESTVFATHEVIASGVLIAIVIDWTGETVDGNELSE